MVRYFEPQCLPGQAQRGDRFGGAPSGLPPARWPACLQCGRPQAFLAQLSHESLGLPPGAALYLFICQEAGGSDCETWDHSAGANAAVLLLPAERAGEALTEAPPGAHRLPPLKITGWAEADDGLSEAQLELLHTDLGARRLRDEAPALLDRLGQQTRLGGGPVWLQSAEEGPPGWRFAAQLDESVALEGGGSVEHGGNFGCGLAYVHIAPSGAEATLFWQC